MAVRRRARHNAKEHLLIAGGKHLIATFQVQDLECAALGETDMQSSRKIGKLQAGHQWNCRPVGHPLLAKASTAETHTHEGGRECTPQRAIQKSQHILLNRGGVNCPCIWNDVRGGAESNT